MIEFVVMPPVVVRNIIVKNPATPAAPTVMTPIPSVINLDVSSLQESVTYPGLWS